MSCPFDPSPLVDVPLGMFHCPECGEMVVAGLPHPDYDDLDFDCKEGDPESRCVTLVCPIHGDHREKPETD